MRSRGCLHNPIQGAGGTYGVLSSVPDRRKRAGAKPTPAFIFPLDPVPFSYSFFPPSTFKNKSQKHSCDFEYWSRGHRLRFGEAWACLVLYLLWNNFQKARPFLHFYLLSNENSFLVFTDHKGKQSVWFTCLEFRPRSNLFFYLNKMAQKPACYCRKASTFPESTFLFCVKFKNSRTLLGWSSQSWL